MVCRTSCSRCCRSTRRSRRCGAYAGLEVTATEPVFGYMADALGLRMRNRRFQLAVMNNAEPAASDVAAFENDLRERRVRALIYNSQATDNAARRLLRLAEAVPGSGRGGDGDRAARDDVPAMDAGPARRARPRSGAEKP